MNEDESRQFYEINDAGWITTEYGGPLVAVPEPSALALLMATAPLLTRWRKKRI
jgi:hypothetical protein